MTGDLYVVLEYNQASGQPRLYDYNVYDTREAADDTREYAETQTRAIGRRETYEVARVEPLEEED